MCGAPLLCISSLKISNHQSGERRYIFAYEQLYNYHGINNSWIKKYEVGLIFINFSNYTNIYRSMHQDLVPFLWSFMFTDPKNSTITQLHLTFKKICYNPFMLIVAAFFSNFFLLKNGRSFEYTIKKVLDFSNRVKIQVGNRFLVSFVV